MIIEDRENMEVLKKSNEREDEKELRRMRNK